MFSSLIRSIDCIIEPIDGKGGLYLGNFNAANDVPNLKKMKIKAVLTVANASYLSYNKSDIPNHKIIPAEDYESFNLLVYFDDGIEFIEKNLENTNVLCHCLAGVSRSATLVIAYLMKTKRLTYLKALALTLSKRSIIYPNGGFTRQLMEFEKDLKL